MIGKKFTDLTTGNVVTVKDIFEDIVILDNSTKIKLNRLSDKNFFDEYIDPNDFFKNESLLNSFASKIRQIPENIVNNIVDDGENINLNNIPGSTSIKPMINESAILPSDPEIEKEELMRKYNINSNSNISEANKQFEKFQKILSDENETEEVVQRIEVNRDENGVVNRVVNSIKKEDLQIMEPPKVEDPIVSMFKNCKRNTDFKISIDIENKIPRPDFIEMMEDSYTTSIIDFLANEFTNNILNDPNIIKEKIVNEINRIVYGEMGDKKIEDNSINKSTLDDIPEIKTDNTTKKKRVYKSRKKIENINDR